MVRAQWKSRSIAALSSAARQEERRPFLRCVDPVEKKASSSVCLQKERSSGLTTRKVTALSSQTIEAKTSSYTTRIAGGGFKPLDEGEKVTYEVVRGRRGVQARNVSRAPSSSGRSFERRDTLTVPVEVEAAARVLAQYFDPDERYEGMVSEARP
jgi:hypothetical protein